MVGLDAKNLHRFVITVVYLFTVFLLAAVARFIAAKLPKRFNPVPSFWIRQGTNMMVANPSTKSD